MDNIWYPDIWSSGQLIFCTSEHLDNWSFVHLNLSSIVQKISCPKDQLSKVQLTRVQLSKVQLSKDSWTTDLFDNWTFWHLNLSSVVQKISCPKVQMYKCSNAQKISCPEDQISGVQLSKVQLSQVQMFTYDYDLTHKSSPSTTNFEASSLC